MEIDAPTIDGRTARVRAMPGAKRSGQGGGGGGKRQNYHPPTPGVSELGRGMRGVLLTCDTHLERQAIREGFALLDQYAGGETAAPAEPAAACADGGGVATGANTAADALAAELAGLRRDGAADGSDAPDPAAGGRRRFSVAQTGCTGSIVIRFGLPADDPLATSTRVMEAAVASAESGAPHVIRLFPVQAVCGATPAAIRAAVAPLLETMRGYTGTFSVQWRRRHNSNVDKMAVIDAVAQAVAAVAPEAKVALRSPAAAVVVEVIKSDAVLAVLPRWREFGEYNLRALAEAKAARTKAALAEADGQK